MNLTLPFKAGTSTGTFQESTTLIPNGSWSLRLRLTSSGGHASASSRSSHSASASMPVGSERAKVILGLGL